MRIALFSNFLNHHMLPLCQEFCRITNNQFVFVATRDVPESRKKMGYHNMNDQYDFVLKTYESKENEMRAMEIALSYDAIITGSAPEEYTIRRIEETNKLTFRYSERIYKNGLNEAINCDMIRGMKRAHTYYKNKNMYLLAASAYAAFDYGLFGAYTNNKAFRWGYFPRVNAEEVYSWQQRNNEVPIILWAGRFLEWKRLDYVIEMAKILKEKGLSFKVEIIGSGSEEKNICEMIDKYQLGDCVRLLGNMSPEEVQKCMQNADVYMFTSDCHEGWGAVLNEAMGNGCAVVANMEAGATPFLINDGVNGLLFKSFKEMVAQTETLLCDENKRQRLEKNACLTMKKKWNSSVAAKRFIELCDLLQKGEKPNWSDGPCSLISRGARLKYWKSHKGKDKSYL